MSKARIKQHHLHETDKIRKDETSVFYCCDTEVDKGDVEGLERFLQRDPNIFLLNNLLMTVQFFENFERDVEKLRGNWYKEISLESHHKRFFYADSLFRLARSNVKFIPRHGINKGKESLLHPLRIFVSSDNVEAAFDPTHLGRIKSYVKPQYQLTVNICEKKKEKSGFIFLTEFKTITDKSKLNTSEDLQAPRESLKSNDSTDNFSVHLRRKSNFDQRNSRRLTLTEKFIAYLNKEVSSRISEKRRSMKYSQILTEDVLPHNAFYHYIKREARLKPRSIGGFRMNTSLQASHEIPKRCFQKQEIKRKLNSRREGVKKRDSDTCFISKQVLNSAAFKGYFCDLLIRELAEPLGLDFNMVSDSAILEESVIISQEGVQNQIVPVVIIKDWNGNVEITKKLRNRTGELEWPTVHMRQFMEILPCYAVPDGYSNRYEDNLDYEKEWKLVFPKAEEYLLLHMMHAQIRCYFFVLAIYKSFIEPETNSACFGPKHLLHHLFWKVHSNFTAWPDDRPGEILIDFFQALYKKIQNKYLPDFFITSRNLFANSLQKDLHRVQSVIKKIIENPLPYVMHALKNVYVDPVAYPTFDISKFHKILMHVDKPPAKSKKRIKKNEKTVRFEEKVDEQKRWTKSAIKQIELEKKAEEQLNRLSIDSINTEEFLRWDPKDAKKFKQIIEAFVSHFTEMGIKSIENKCLTQALTYLYQIQRLMEIVVIEEENQQELQGITENIHKLIEKCNNLKRNNLSKAKPEVPKNKPKISSNNDGGVQTNELDKKDKKTEKVVIRIADPENNAHLYGEYECETKL